MSETCCIHQEVQGLPEASTLLCQSLLETPCSVPCSQKCGRKKTGLRICGTIGGDLLIFSPPDFLPNIWRGSTLHPGVTKGSVNKAEPLFWVLSVGQVCTHSEWCSRSPSRGCVGVGSLHIPAFSAPALCTLADALACRCPALSAAPPVQSAVPAWSTSTFSVAKQFLWIKALQG